MHSAIDISKDRLVIDDLAPRLARGGGIVGVIALAASFALSLMSGEHGLSTFFRAYIHNYAFVLSILLGALFFVLLQHLTRAGWSVVVRRLGEHMIGAFPVMALLFLPILVPIVLRMEAMQHVYEWTNAAVVAKDHLLHAKETYLNPVAFAIRAVVYFGVWIGVAAYFRGQSIRQDASGDAAITARLQVRAAPCMLLFALTATFMSVDLLMSLNPHWFSTIFGVYFFAGSFLGFSSLLALLLHLLQRSGRMTQAVSIEHYHDVGKWMFAFVVFWAYIGFSQYMLIWYANLPEEQIFYVLRQQGAWLVLSFVLLFGHFVLPFLAIISRHPKRNPGLLALAACWLLLMHWLDVGWLVHPHAEAIDLVAHKVTASELTASTVLHSVLCLVGLGGVASWAVLSRVGSTSLVPLRDPRLGESLAFENA